MTFVKKPGFEDEILRSTGVRDALEQIAEEGAARYREGVPVDEGDLRDSTFGDVALTDEGYVGRIGATDYKAALVEFGTFEHAPDASLREALESMGLEIEIQEGRY